MRAVRAAAMFVRFDVAWLSAAVGIVVLVGALAMFLETAPAADAGSSPPDIYQAAQDVQAGSASTSESELYQAFVDWVETQGGAVSSSVTYQTINGVQWSQDAYESALQTALQSTASGGSTEAAVGGELASSAADLGVVQSIGEAVAESPAGVACVTAAAACAGAVVATVAVGALVYTLFNDSQSSEAFAPGSSQGTTNAVGLVKAWAEPYGSCQSFTGFSGSWQPMRFHQYNGFQRTTPIIYGTGMPPLTSWRGSGYIYNHGNNWPESSSVAVPCGTQLSGGGAWFAVWDLPQTPQTAAGWYLEDGAAWDTASPIAMSANCGAGLFWTPPMPAAAPWNRLSWPDDSAEPYDTECGYASGVGLMKQDTQVMWEQGSQVHVSMPKPGSCAGAPSGTCIAAATKPSSSWCTSAACVSSLFDPVNGQGANYGNLRQLVDSAIGATNPATGNSNPPGLVAIPDCSAMTVSACRSALSAAGFTNTTTSTLTTDEADLTKPAGAVVTTSPSRGTSEDTATAITLNINPDPLPVVVPAIQGNESPGSYTSQITQAGLQSSVTTLAATDTTVADGDVVEAEPQPGTRVAPNSTVDVAVNSDPSKISQQDPRCDVDNGAGAPGSPGNPPSDGTNYPWYQTAPGTQAPYTADVDPTNSSPAQTEIPLRWGTTGWGWTHILIKHPYTTADENQVIEALATDQAPTPTGNTSTNQWDFHYFYDVPDGANDGGSVTCVRTVRVEYWQDSRATNAGVYGIRGIQNTFTGLYTGGIQGH